MFEGLSFVVLGISSFRFFKSLSFCVPGSSLAAVDLAACVDAAGVCHATKRCSAADGAFLLNFELLNFEQRGFGMSVLTSFS